MICSHVQRAAPFSDRTRLTNHDKISSAIRDRPARFDGGVFFSSFSFFRRDDVTLVSPFATNRETNRREFGGDG